MGDKDLRPMSQSMRCIYKREKEACWYEEPSGIRIMTHDAQFRISWGALRAALERKDQRSDEN